MVSIENRPKFEQLLSQLKDLFDDNTVSVKLLLTSGDTKMTTYYKYAEDLKKKNVSMRNIKGEFIK